MMPNLTEAGVATKSEEYQQCLLTIATELNELNNNEDEDDADDFKQDTSETTALNT
jgi:hypothetical protein